MRTVIPYFFLFVFCLPALGFADITSLPAQTLEDQWGKPHQLNNSTHLVIVTHHKEGGDWVKDFLSTLSPEAQAMPGWLYIADIHKMPGFITKMIALPRMRDYTFPVAIIRDSQTLQGWPRQEDQVTVMTVNNLQISEVNFFADKVALQAQLQALWPQP